MIGQSKGVAGFLKACCRRGSHCDNRWFDFLENFAIISHCACYGESAIYLTPELLM